MEMPLAEDFPYHPKMQKIQKRDALGTAFYISYEAAGRTEEDDLST